MSQSPSLEEVIEAAIEERFDHVYTAMPGRVLAYNARYSRVDVQPDVRQYYVSEEGENIAVKLPAIKSVPLLWPGAGSARLTFPMAKLHTVLLVFTNCEMEGWKSTRRAVSEGGGGDAIPRSDRRFKLGDAVAIPGLAQFEKIGIVDNTATDRIQLGYQSGPKVDITSGQIRLGGSSSAIDPQASQSALLGDNFQTALDLLLGALNTFAGTCTTTPGGTATALATAVTAFQTAWSTMLSNVVKVK